jgi:putative flavoprotein involved in K+ transport
MEPADVLVLGAGPTGLAAAAELRRRGLRAVVLERSDAIAARWRSRYDGLRLNTWNGLSRLPGSRFPRSAGRYASRDAFVAYLEAYARRHAVDVRFGVAATRVDGDGDGGWVVASSDGLLASRYVVVATGWDAEPNLPDWASGAEFAGPVLHASEVRDLSQFAGRRVLVVGAGNSGVDLSGLLVRAGADVTVSMRTPPNIFPRDWLGVPLGPVVLLSEGLPSWAVDPIGRFIQWQVFGDLTPYGIPRAPQGFLTRFRAGVNPAVDDGFVDALKSGRASVVGEVRALERGGAILATGEHRGADVVVCATGYRRGLGPLVGHLGVLNPGGAPLYADGVPSDPAAPGLYFAGFRVALSGQIHRSSGQARRIAKAIAVAGRRD